MEEIVTFIEWLNKNHKELAEATVMRHRPELEDHASLSKIAIDVGDMIDLGPETKFKGQRVPKYARVTRVQGGNVEAINLSDGKTMVISIDLLHEKPKESMPAQYQDDLRKLGASKIFEKLTPRQSKRKPKGSPESSQPTGPQTPEVSKSDILRLKKILMSDPLSDAPSDTDSDPLKSLFAKEPEEKPVVSPRRPLASFVKGNTEPELKLGTFKFGQ